jgi:hypothetical protein
MPVPENAVTVRIETIYPGSLECDPDSSGGILEQGADIVSGQTNA